MSRDSYASHPLREIAPDLSKMSQEELDKLRDMVMERARNTMDPNGLGLDVLMQTTDDSSWFSTDDVSFRDWMDWVQQTIRVISDSATRIGAGILAAGGAVAASNLYATEAGSRFAGATLALSAAFGLWFVASAVGSALRGR
jgi:hypothetical protein